MSDVYEPVAAYIGELYAAALHDLETANPSDVGLNGVPIRAWREAYLEGCKDMAEGIVTRIPEQHREAIKTIVHSSAEKEIARLREQMTKSQRGTPE